MRHVPVSLRPHPRSFCALTDPRRREVVYPLINIVSIAICAVIAGADDFVSIAEYGCKKRKWLGQFLDLSAGIPSHDRFNAIFGAILPAEFERCLLSWITALHEVTEEDRGHRRQDAPPQLRRGQQQVGHSHGQRWATANHISLGQVVVDEKSNEITAIPNCWKSWRFPAVW